MQTQPYTWTKKKTKKYTNLKIINYRNKTEILTKRNKHAKKQAPTYRKKKIKKYHTMTNKDNPVHAPIPSEETEN